jgi:2-oxoglutarate dehydrogenase E2 component (dihydrolipoamide succinyltransferase)
MLRSKHTSPHVTTVFEADMGRVLAHLEQNQATFARDGVKLTLTAYFISAIVAGLRAVPLVNSQWAEDGAGGAARIILKREINVGLAVALDAAALGTPAAKGSGQGDGGGLIVPVLRRADEKSLLGLAREINDLARRARSKSLKPEEVQGGTFTLTNHGVSGSLFATPIINQPQCAILGAGIIQKRAVVINDAIAIRPMIYLSLTFDHRILDGASGDHFLAQVVETLQNWS